MPLNPLFARVLIQREKLTAKSGLILPPGADKRNARFRGQVVATGPTADESVKALVGKTVLFGIYAGTWLNEDGTMSPTEGDYFVCADEDLIAVVE